MDFSHFYYILTLILIPSPFVVYSLIKVKLKPLLKVAIICTAVGLPWEYLAVNVLHIWAFNHSYTSSIWIGNWMPIEEIFFYPYIGMAVAGVSEIRNGGKPTSRSKTRNRESHSDIPERINSSGDSDGIEKQSIS